MPTPVNSGSFTIIDVNETVSGSLSNPAAVVSTANDGSGGDYTGAGGVFDVFEGQTKVTSSGLVAYSVVAGSISSGLTIAIASASGVYSASLNSATDTGSATLRAVYKGVTVDQIYSISKSKSGGQGPQGPSVIVSADRALSFTATDGALDAGQSNINFTCAVFGVSSPTYVWTFSGFQSAPTNSGNANLSVTQAQFGTSRSVTVTCTVNGTYSQTLTIVRLEKSTAAAGANQTYVDAGGNLQGVSSGAGTSVSNALVQQLAFVNAANMVIQGNTAYKSSATAAWDSSFYSKDGHVGGAFVSFSPAQANANLAVGLNTDPTTNNAYTSIDFAWLCDSSGGLSCAENGTLAYQITTYAAGDVLAITYDGVTVRYLKNGSVIRSVAASVSLPLYADSSFYGNGGKVTNLQFGPMASLGTIVIDPATGAIQGVGTGAGTVVDNSFIQQVTLLNAANMTVAGNTATKTGGAGNAWDSSFYSKDRYSGAAWVSFTPAQANAALFVGLNTDPLTDNSFGSIDYAWYLNELGSCETYVSGSTGGTAGAYVAGDVFAIQCDGLNVWWVKNGTVVRTLAVSVSGDLYVDSSFMTLNGKVKNVQFGPMSNLNQLTPSIAALKTTTWVVSANATVLGDSFTQTATGSAIVYSKDGYTGGVYMSFSPGQTNKSMMIGLDYTTPVGSPDFAFNCQTDGTMTAYESWYGGSVVSFGAYAVGDVLAMTYDGANIRYYKNGALLRTYAVSISGTIWCDTLCTNLTTGATATNLQFGPLSSVAGFSTLSGTETLTNKTLTSPTITTPTVSSPTINGVANLASGQIQFPATQNPSGNAYTLDDYEEGVWTPSLVATSAVFSYAAQVGAYTKVGNEVTVTCRIQLATTGNTLNANALTLSGLPFISGNVTNRAFRCSIAWNSITTAMVGISGRLAVNSSVLTLYKRTAATTTSDTVMVASDVSATAGSVLELTLTYMT